MCNGRVSAKDWRSLPVLEDETFSPEGDVLSLRETTFCSNETLERFRVKPTRKYRRGREEGKEDGRGGGGGDVDGGGF